MRNAEWQGAARNYSAPRIPHSALGSRGNGHLRHVGPVAGGDAFVPIAHPILADLGLRGVEQRPVVHVGAFDGGDEELPRAAVATTLDEHAGAAVFEEGDRHALAGRSLFDFEGEFWHGI